MVYAHHMLLPLLLAAERAAVDLPAHVGVVCALPIESGSLLGKLSGKIKIQGHGFTVRAGGLSKRRVCVVESGIGQSAAAKAAEALLAGHQPKWMIAAGFAGGLAPQLASA